MLHLRLRVPEDLLDTVTDLLAAEPTTINLAVLPGAYREPAGTLVMADLPREGAQSVLGRLHHLGMAQRGSITIVDDEIVIGEAATRAEQQAPGAPEDGVVWDVVEDRAREDIRMSFAYLAFLVLAVLIASVGRLQDQPILIIGAMVVGPEFAPLAAICLALARPRLSLLPRALGTLLGGYLIAALACTVVWFAAYRFGAFSLSELHHGPLTQFIVEPNVWSFVIALLAGVAGTLSLTTDKSSTLVGVFISVTTVPAVATLSLSLATGDWHYGAESLYQLGINLAGILVAGTLTLLLQRAAWSHTSLGPPRRGRSRSGWYSSRRL